jgi:hypothetical protein
MIIILSILQNKDFISGLSFLPGLFSIYLSPKEIILEFYELSGKLEVANPFSPNCIFGIYFKGIIGITNKKLPMANLSLGVING